MSTKIIFGVISTNKKFMRNALFMILCIMVLSGLVSCQTPVRENEQSRVVVPLCTPNDSLEIVQNLKDDYMIVQTKHNNDIISICGGGNVDFCRRQDNSIVIDTVIFDETGVSYVLPLYVKGSTYGAVENYVIYREYGESAFWLVYRVPFSNVEFMDADEDGISDIIAYYANDSTVYSFTNGCLYMRR